MRCLAGLTLFGIGIALIVDSELGNGPWDVFHQGVADRLGVGIGTVIIATGAALMLLWIPLRVRPGIGTVLNAVQIGLVVDVMLPLLPEPQQIVLRVGYLASGIMLMGAATALYIGSGLGPGPRDGLMTGLAARGWKVRTARTVIEVAVMVTGFALGGTVGVGTAVFALTIGPLVQWFLPRLSLDPVVRSDAAASSGTVIESPAR
ncbi:membrane protein [soil metagenome]